MYRGSCCVPAKTWKVHEIWQGHNVQVVYQNVGVSLLCFVLSLSLSFASIRSFKANNEFYSRLVSWWMEISMQTKAEIQRSNKKMPNRGKEIYYKIYPRHTQRDTNEERKNGIEHSEILSERKTKRKQHTHTRLSRMTSNWMDVYKILKAHIPMKFLHRHQVKPIDGEFYYV